MFTQSYTIQHILDIDIAYQALMEGIRTPFLTDIVLTITHLGDPVVLFLISALIVLVLWMKKKSIEVIAFASIMFAGAGMVWLLKHGIARPRPLGIIAETGFSFPSGHALMASVFFPFLLYLFKNKIPKGWKRNTFVIGGVVLMIAIVLSRPYIGVHYLSDVLAGLLIGVLISAFGILVVEGYQRKHSIHS